MRKLLPLVISVSLAISAQAENIQLSWNKGSYSNTVTRVMGTTNFTDWYVITNVPAQYNFVSLPKNKSQEFYALQAQFIFHGTNYFKSYATHLSVELAWGDTPYSTYIYWGDSPDSLNNRIDAGELNTISFGQFSQGSVYYFAATSYLGDIESIKSDIIPVRFPSGPTITVE